MGTISRLNSVQFEAMNENSLSGVTLVYKSVNRDGEVHEKCVNFDGAEFVPVNDTQDEVFRVWKNVVATFWCVKAKEMGLKVDNGGIQCKLYAGTPSRIIVRSADGKACKKWDVEGSVWARIGLVPTKKDLEACARDFKKKIHAATKASFDALSFRVNFNEVAAQAGDESAAAAPAKKSAKKEKAA